MGTTLNVFRYSFLWIFFEYRDGTFQSVGVSNQYLTGRSRSISKIHQRNIRKGISQAFDDYKKYKLTPFKTNTTLLDLKHGFNDSLIVGAYLTYNTLIRNQNRPIENEVQISIQNGSESHQYYNIKEGKNIRLRLL